MFKRIFMAHPASVGESYPAHLAQALTFAAAMFVGAVACLIHAFIPSLFERAGSAVIERLHSRMIINRGRQEDRSGPRAA